MHLLGETVVIDWYTQNAAGADANADSTPSCQITGPGGVTNVTPSSVGTGHYRTTHTPTVAGVHAYKLTAVIGGVTVVDVKTRTVRDGVSEGRSVAFPDGLASWSPAF